MTEKEYLKITATMEVMADDVQDRFAERCGLFAITSYENDEGTYDLDFNWVGDSNGLAVALGQILEERPETVLLIQRAVQEGDATMIMSNFLDFLSTSLPGLRTEDDDDPDNPFGLD